MPKLLLDFVVWGEAVPQGSMSNYGKGRVTHSKREKLMDWRRLIQLAVQAKAPQFRQDLVRCPVAIVARFFFTRPKSVPKSAVYKRTTPDTDKLCRAVGDALENTVLVNDSCVVAWHACKLYCQGASHTEIELWELDAADVSRASQLADSHLFSEALPFAHGP
jgi:Holliday junction resolvase RusA-like endonuclease